MKKKKQSRWKDDRSTCQCCGLNGKRWFEFKSNQKYKCIFENNSSLESKSKKLKT